MTTGDPVASLHPAVAHHIASTLGWRSLRPLQKEAIAPILGGEHALVLAPTAGGKTEAAIFPLLSRMLTEDWRGLTVLYVCPLRALLNNLHERLEWLLGLVGRRAALWHGDVGAAKRRRILSDPPDLLLTTPESLEAMLVSRRVDERDLFRQLRAAVVDEIHAFAGDDRGWHLLAVLHRVERLAKHHLQRVGLSATVGNPDELLAWLTRTSTGPAAVVAPPAADAVAPEVTVDYVGDLFNAALVISRLHRGEKRLVFGDSRARVEQLAVELRRHGVETFVSHGSLGRDERRRAEAAFASAVDCVIVATSTLELGIDVGDLDRVIQIDAPGTVASFLQRMGRSGRRAGTSRNTLFLTTSDEALLQATALARLWEFGYVEPLEPPALPLHIVAQQVLALVLEEGGIGRNLVQERFGEPFVLGPEAASYLDDIVSHLLEEGFLHEDNGLLGVGAHGEERFGRRHFLELLSVFTSPPVFTVLHGQTEIGAVPDTMLQLAEDREKAILLAGRSWFVRHVDWTRKAVYVEPSEQPGVASWFGSGRALSAVLCREIREVLAGADPATATLSKRATAKLAELRDDFPWVRSGATALVRSADGSLHWWTFAGLLTNMWLGELLAPLREHGPARHNLRIRLASEATYPELIESIRGADIGTLSLRNHLSGSATRVLKFADCIPDDMAVTVLERRFDGSTDALSTLTEDVTSNASGV